MVRVYTICYRKNAVRHSESTFCEFIEALKFISERKLIDRYRVQIVNGNNTELLFDSASIKKHAVFNTYLQYAIDKRAQGDKSKWGDLVLIEYNPPYIVHIRQMCVLNKDRCKHYKSAGHLLNDQYC